MPRYDPATALIIVDVQNDFADPDGSLYVRGGETVVPKNTIDELVLARVEGKKDVVTLILEAMRK